MKLSWDMLFYSAQVHVMARINAYRRPLAMPLEKDDMALRNFLLQEMASMCSDVRLRWDSHDFVRLRNLTVCRLTMFNARGGGEPEPARLTIKEWDDAFAEAWDLVMAVPRSQQSDYLGSQQSDPPGGQQRADDVFPGKRVAAPKMRRAYEKMCRKLKFNQKKTHNIDIASDSDDQYEEGETYSFETIQLNSIRATVDEAYVILNVNVPNFPVKKTTLQKLKT
ncbi:hypothetical protein ElyMa_006817400 [Elysia marginata]|uniref:Uncharacterized protein n=1 Tax=Elysia marginata TaxID=1093978 RepID=A0AAV4J320_9GAST|nr:hypothetical protein ElyMa_006817400 [Elysia marginata]